MSTIMAKDSGRGANSAKGALHYKPISPTNREKSQPHIPNDPKTSQIFKIKK
jgi:hypothetical protein